MDDSKQKNLFLIGLLLIIVIVLSISLKSTNLSANRRKNSSVDLFENLDYNQNSLAIEQNEENTNSTDSDYEEPKEKNTETKTTSTYYYSSDYKYNLILIDNNSDKKYVLNIDEYISTSSFSGTYNINENYLTLIIEDGCLNESGDFNCVIPDGISIIKKENLNSMNLSYNEDTIYFGDIKLVKQN